MSISACAPAKRGYEVHYCAESVLYHLESATRDLRPRTSAPTANATRSVEGDDRSRRSPVLHRRRPDELFVPGALPDRMTVSPRLITWATRRLVPGERPAAGGAGPAGKILLRRQHRAQHRARSGAARARSRTTVAMKRISACVRPSSRPTGRTMAPMPRRRSRHNIIGSVEQPAYSRRRSPARPCRSPAGPIPHSALRPWKPILMASCGER